MRVKTHALRDFSGGLCSAVSPTMLAINQSPDLSNVDIMDSRAITRRNGYVAITSTPIAATASKGFTRYYKSDGTKYWLSAHGSTLYGRQDGASDVPLTRLESEDAVVGKVAANVLVGGAYSGGKAYLLAPSVAYTFDIPYSSSVAARLYAPYASPTVSASWAVDGGAYSNISVTASAGYTYSAGLTATHHHIVVKPSAAVENTLEDSSTRLAWSGAYTQYTLQDEAEYSAGTYTSLDGDGGKMTLYFYGTRCKLYGRKSGTRGKARVTLDKVTVTTVDCYNATVQNKQLLWDSGDVAFGRHSVEVEYTHTKNAASTGYNIIIDSLKATEGGVLVDYFDYAASSEFVSASPAISASAGNIAYVQAAGSIYFGTRYNAMRAYTGATGTTTLFDSPPWTAGTLYAKGDAIYVTASGWVCATPHTAASWTAEKASNWTARTGTGVPYAPKADYLVYLKTRVFAAHADSDLIEYTALDSSTDWTGGGALRLVGPESGIGCTGMRVFQNRVAWFSHSRFHLLDTTGEPAAWVNKTISTTHGCIAPKSIAEAENKIVFLAPDGVRAYGAVPGIASEEGNGITWLSEAITPTLDSIPAAMRSKAAGAVYKGRYWLACALPTDDTPTPTTNNSILLYKFAEKGNPASWTRYDDINIGEFVVTRGDEYGLFGTDSANGNVYKLDTGGTDNGAAIPMRYSTPPIAIAGYEYTKHFPHLYVSAASPSAQVITVETVTGDVDGATAVLTLTPSTDSVPVRANISARGRSIQYIVTSDGADQPLTIDAITCTYNQPRLR